MQPGVVCIEMEVVVSKEKQRIIVDVSPSRVRVRLMMSGRDLPTMHCSFNELFTTSHMKTEPSDFFILSGMISVCAVYLYMFIFTVHSRHLMSSS